VEVVSGQILFECSRVLDIEEKLTASVYFFNYDAEYIVRGSIGLCDLGFFDDFYDLDNVGMVIYLFYAIDLC
jgi:hypothetical protein